MEKWKEFKTHKWGDSGGEPQRESEVLPNTRRHDRVTEMDTVSYTGRTVTTIVTGWFTATEYLLIAFRIV